MHTHSRTMRASVVSAFALMLSSSLAHPFSLDSVKLVLQNAYNDFPLTTLPNRNDADDLTADVINTMGKNSLFTRWRPQSHFIAPAGWMNDPCGPMYDPATGLYHLQYQFHPHHVAWGHISWGHATSRDLVTWTDVNHLRANDLHSWEGTQPASIMPTESKYERLGIWSGTAQPINLAGQADGTLLAFYTSLSYLPTEWRLHYQDGTETQSLATSSDGGVTWTHYAENPVIRNPPWPAEYLTGWRDPFLFPSPQLDALLQQSQPHYYAIFGSGIKHDGPRVPMYSAPANDLTQWTFLGALWEPETEDIIGLGPDLGCNVYNYEVANMFELDGHWFVSAGTQGNCSTTDKIRDSWNIWHEGTIAARQNSSVEFTPRLSGVMDWGLLYALTTFEDKKNNRRIQWGWAREDMGDLGILQQGFQGAFAIPRELFLLSTHGVVHDPRDQTIGIDGTTRFEPAEDGAWTATTLGIRPAEDVVAGLRNGATYRSTNSGDSTHSKLLWPEMSRSYELKITIRGSDGPAGVIVAASPDLEEHTRIYWDPQLSRVVCAREDSSLIPEYAKQAHYGYFYPYTFDPSTPGREHMRTEEDIEMRVFVDGSLIEVYVNERFALTSRVYPSRTDSIGAGLFVAPGTLAHFGVLEAWDGLLNAWPERPMNSSTELIKDTWAETGNGTWWTGN